MTRDLDTALDKAADLALRVWARPQDGKTRHALDEAIAALLRAMAGDGVTREQADQIMRALLDRSAEKLKAMVEGVLSAKKLDADQRANLRRTLDQVFTVALAR